MLCALEVPLKTSQVQPPKLSLSVTCRLRNFLIFGSAINRAAIRAALNLALAYARGFTHCAVLCENSAALGLPGIRNKTKLAEFTALSPHYGSHRHQ